MSGHSAAPLSSRGGNPQPAMTAPPKIEPELNVTIKTKQPSPFQYASLNESQRVLVDRLRAAYENLYEELRVLPVGRYSSLAKTALEESAMWANKAVSHEWKQA